MGLSRSFSLGDDSVTVYFNHQRKRWMYNFRLKGERYAGYCLTSDGEPVTARTTARQAEAMQRHRAANVVRKISPTDHLTLAQIMADLTPVWERQAHWPNKRRYMKEILEFFGPATPLANIDDGRIADYVRHLKTAPTRAWHGGPHRHPTDPEFEKFWVTVPHPRSPATSNLYLGMLRQTLCGRLRFETR